MTKLYCAIENAMVVLTMESGQARCDLRLKGHNIACVTVDPVRPQFVYCGTFDSGLWRSDNAGESWRPAGEGHPHWKVQSVAVSRCERLRVAASSTPEPSRARFFDPRMPAKPGKSVTA